MKKLLLILMALTAASILFTSCLRKNYDRPPDNTGDDPKIPVTHTIAQLKALNGLYNPTTGGDTTLITEDVVISGIVAADDRSGNLYKQIVIQDSTGGIFLNINSYSLYSNYPVGRRVYVKCKGLTLGYNGGVAELGSSLTEQLAVNALAGSEIGNHIIKGPVGNPVTDTVISLSAVKSITATSDNRALIGRLITITDVQFLDTNLTYTDPSATTNRTFTDCLGSTSSMAMRTSNYAAFHAQRLAVGHGSITGIFTIYQTALSITPQLVIRDTSDVKMYSDRCGTIVGSSIVTIDSLRRMYAGSGTTTLPAVKVTGTVISDLTKGNVSSGNFILEDASRKGIIMYLSGGSYNLGDSLLIDATGAKLQLYNGAMELTGLSSSKISKKATGKTVAPVILTIAQLNASFAQYESVLVKISNATVTGGGTYSGNKTLTDGTGSISLYTSSAATFAGSPVPSIPKSFTGIGTLYTPNEIKLRDPAIDVK